MDRLASNVQLDEANKLVGIGITSLARFMWMSKLRFLRARLAIKSDIPEERIQRIYFATRGKLSLNRGSRVRGGLAIAVLILTVSGIVYFQSNRYWAETQYSTDLEQETGDDQGY